MKYLFLLVILSASLFSFSQEICDNGIDDDGDGLIDLQDTIDCTCDFGSGINELIPNPSFEDMNCCPYTYSQLNCASQWLQASAATSDYYNCGGISSIPDQAAQDPPVPLPDGTGYLGFFNGDGYNGQYKEYIGACLLDTLYSGVSYQIQFNMSASLGNLNTTLTLFGTATCSELPFGSAFHTSCPIYQGSSWQVLGSSTVTLDGTSWSLITIDFVPSSNITAFVLGPNCNSVGNERNYYFIDNMTLNPSQSLSISETGSFCKDSKELTAQIDTTGGTWQWYYNDIALVGETNATLDLSNNGLLAGSYSVIYTLSTSCEKKDIIVSPPKFPLADFRSDIVCETNPTSFTDLSISNATSIIDWNWDFTSDAIINDTLQNPINTYSSGGSFNAYLRITNDEGCSHDTTKLVFVNPNPEIDFSGGDVCDGNVINFLDQSTIAFGNNVSWSWNFGDGIGGSLAQDTSYLYAIPNTYNVTLVVVSDSLCSNSRTQTVNIWNNPTANFSFNNSCAQSSAQFTSTSSGGGGGNQNLWDFTSDGTTDQYGIYSAFTYTNPNSYPVTLITITSDGCVDTISKDITISPLPVTLLSGQNICEGGTVNFINNSTIALGNIDSYAWDFANGNTSVQTSPGETFTTQGVYNVSLTSISDKNCRTTNYTSIEVYPLPVSQFLTADVCDGNQVSFTDFSTVSNQYTTNNITNWDWSFGDNSGTSSNQFANYLYSSDGTYNVNLTVTTNNGCVDSLQQNIVIFPNPVVSFTSPNPIGCTQLCSNYNNTSTISPGTISDFLWSFGDGNISTVATPVNCIDNETLLDQSYTVSLTVTSNNGCQTTFTAPNFITVYPNPVSDFEPSTYETTIYQTTIEFSNTSQLGDTYDWDFDQLAYSSEKHPSYSFPNEDLGSYFVCLQTNTIHNCYADTCKKIVINNVSNYYIPNTFSPNNDGINDVFIPILNGISTKNFQFSIFDRWGQLLYNSMNPELVEWNGLYRGTESQIDTYIWKLTGLENETSKKVFLTGHINLIR